MVFVAVIGSKTKQITIPFAKEGKEEQLVVIFAGKGSDRIELNLSAIHRAPRTKGRITVRGVLRDRAAIRVRGLIKIEKNAQWSEDFLDGRALLLDEGAQAEILPYLEIEADAVRASHSAAVGMLDQEQLFYLRSRGLSERQAQGLLVAGFLDRAVADPWRKKIASAVEEVKAYALG